MPKLNGIRNRHEFAYFDTLMNMESPIQNLSKYVTSSGIGLFRLFKNIDRRDLTNLRQPETLSSDQYVTIGKMQMQVWLDQPVEEQMRSYAILQTSIVPTLMIGDKPWRTMPAAPVPVPINAVFPTNTALFDYSVGPAQVPPRQNCCIDLIVPETAMGILQKTKGIIRFWLRGILARETC